MICGWSLSRFRNFPAVVTMFLLLSLTLLIVLSPRANAMRHSYDEHAGMSMPMDTHIDPAMQAKILSDKRESEFNHHLAGFFVVLGGLFILAERNLSKRFTGARYVWPLSFLLSGLFVLVFSDTELWPFVLSPGSTASSQTPKSFNIRRSRSFFSHSAASNSPAPASNSLRSGPHGFFR